MAQDVEQQEEPKQDEQSEQGLQVDHEYQVPPSRSLEPDTGKNPETGEYEVDRIDIACRYGGIQSGANFMTYRKMKDHYDDFYASGAELYVGGLKGVIMDIRNVIVYVSFIIHCLEQVKVLHILMNMKKFVIDE